MSWKIISLILFALVVLCMPASAQFATGISIKDGNININTGDQFSTGISTQNGNVNINIINEITVHKGNVYTMALAGNTSTYKWKINLSSGLKLKPSNTRGSISVLAVNKGKQTIEANYVNSQGTKPIQSIKIILDVI